MLETEAEKAVGNKAPVLWINKKLKKNKNKNKIFSYNHWLLIAYAIWYYKIRLYAERHLWSFLFVQLYVIQSLGSHLYTSSNNFTIVEGRRWQWENVNYVSMNVYCADIYYKKLVDECYWFIWGWSWTGLSHRSVVLKRLKSSVTKEHNHIQDIWHTYVSLLWIYYSATKTC